MSNNDLPCDKCGGHHHPACCPLDLGGKEEGMSKDIERLAKELYSIGYRAFGCRESMDFKAVAKYVQQAILKGKVEEIKHNMTCDSERLNKIRIAELESKIKEKL